MWLVFVFSLALSYDYNGLVIEWKPTTCKTVSCSPGYLSTNFNIHGMWPNNWNGTYPANCGTTPFSITQATEQLLSSCWISYTGNNTSFWQHEWSKHGTCVSPTVTCEDYFSLTANIYLSLNVLHVLGSFGIVPSNTITYPQSQAIGAFYHTPIVSCQLISGVYYLSTIMFCYDHNFNWIPCGGQQGACGNGFLIPLA